MQQLIQNEEIKSFDLHQVIIFQRKKYVNILKQNIKLNDQNFKLKNNKKTIHI